jgi:hypothetical protein
MKIMKNLSQDRWSLGKDLKLRPYKYEGVLLSHSVWSVPLLDTAFDIHGLKIPVCNKVGYSSSLH